MLGPELASASQPKQNLLWGWGEIPFCVWRQSKGILYYKLLGPWRTVTEPILQWATGLFEWCISRENTFGKESNWGLSSCCKYGTGNNYGTMLGSSSALSIFFNLSCKDDDRSIQHFLSS